MEVRRDQWRKRRDQSCESHTGLSVPANSSGRVSLDRYQDLEIDLRECSIARQKRVAGPRDGLVKPLSCITSGLMRGEKDRGLMASQRRRSGCKKAFRERQYGRSVGP